MSVRRYYPSSGKLRLPHNCDTDSDSTMDCDSDSEFSPNEEVSYLAIKYPTTARRLRICTEYTYISNSDSDYDDYEEQPGHSIKCIYLPTAEGLRVPRDCNTSDNDESDQDELCVPSEDSSIDDNKEEEEEQEGYVMEYSYPPTAGRLRVPRNCDTSDNDSEKYELYSAWENSSANENKEEEEERQEEEKEEGYIIKYSYPPTAGRLRVARDCDTSDDESGRDELCVPRENSSVDDNEEEEEQEEEEEEGEQGYLMKYNYPPTASRLRVPHNCDISNELNQESLPKNYPATAGKLRVPGGGDYNSNEYGDCSGSDSESDTYGYRGKRYSPTAGRLHIPSSSDGSDMSTSEDEGENENEDENEDDSGADTDQCTLIIV